MARGYGGGVSTATEAGLGEMVPGIARGGVDASASPAAFGANDARALGAVGEALGQGAATLEQFARQDALIWAQGKAFADQVDWHQRLAQAQGGAPPGAPGFAKGFQQSFAEWSKRQLDAAPNEMAKRALGERYAEMGAMLGDKASAFERTALVDHRETQLKETADNAHGLVFTDPTQLGVVQRQLAELVGGSGLPRTAQEKLMLDLTHSTSAAAWRGMMEKDPRGVMGALLTGNAPGLEQKDRFAILGEGRALARQEAAEKLRALDLQLRMSDRAEREGERALKRQQDATERQGYMLASQGQMTPDWLKAHGPNLSPSATKFLADEVAGAHVVTDPGLYADAHDQIMKAKSQPEVDAILAPLKEQVHSRQGLRYQDFGTLENLGRSVLGGGAGGSGERLPPWYKFNVEQIKLAAGYSDLNPASSGANLRYKAALDGFHTWALANPDAKPEDAGKVRETFAKGAILTSTDSMTLTMLKPEFQVMRPAGKEGEMPTEDFDATDDAIITAQEGGQLTKDQADVNLAINTQRRRAAEAQAKANAAAGIK
jgi:hypothetical protein